MHLSGSEILAQALTRTLSPLFGSIGFANSSLIRQIQPLMPGAGWTGQVGRGGMPFFAPWNPTWIVTWPLQTLCKAKSKCHWRLRTILQWVWTCDSFNLLHLFPFSSVFSVLISTSALKTSFLFSLSQKICSEIMLGVADHILHIREGSFLFVFYDCVGVVFFFPVELPLLASVEW